MRLWPRQPAGITPRQRKRPKLGNASFWLEVVALPLGALALETVPLGAWLQFGAASATNDANQALLPFWALFGMLLGVYALTRWLARRSLSRKWLTSLLVLGWLFTLLDTWYIRLYATFGLPWDGRWLAVLVVNGTSDSTLLAPTLGIALLVTYLWWRGTRLGQTNIAFDAISRTFKIGFAALIAAVLLVGTVSEAARVDLSVRLGLALLVFLFAGLASLSLARLAEIQRRNRERGHAQVSPTRSWVLAMLALSGALVLVLFSVEQVFSYQSWLAFLQPVLDGIGTLLGWVVVALGYLLYWIVSPVARFIASLVAQGKQQEKNQPPQQIPPGLQNSLNHNSGSLARDWVVAAEVVLVVVAVLVLLWVIIRTLRQIQARKPDSDVDEERESLDATRMLAAQLRALLASLAARFQRKGAQARLPLQQGSAIRMLYRRILRQAAAQGLGRRVSETPEEFARRLAPALAQPAPQPALEADLAALTAAYEAARYGEQEPSPAQVEALNVEAARLMQRLAAHQPPAP
jgi:hypothetical protein